MIFCFRPQYYDTDPVFEQGFVFLIVNPHSDDLQIKVLDTGHKNSIIGTVVVRMSDLFNQPNLELATQPLPLQSGGPHATILVGAHLRVLKKPKAKQVFEVPKPVEVPHSESLTVLRQSESLPAPTPVTEILPAAIVSTSVANGSPTPRSPSLDEMIANTLQPMVQTTGNSIDLSDLLSPESEIRQRTSVNGPHGKIKLGLVFDAVREELKVTVFEAKGLPGGDLPDPPGMNHMKQKKILKKSLNKQ